MIEKCFQDDVDHEYLLYPAFRRFSMLGLLQRGCNQPKIECPCSGNFSGSQSDGCYDWTLNGWFILGP